MKSLTNILTENKGAVSYSEFEALCNKIYHQGIQVPRATAPRYSYLDKEQAIEYALKEMAKLYLDDKKITIENK